MRHPGFNPVNPVNPVQNTPPFLVYESDELELAAQWVFQSGWAVANCAMARKRNWSYSEAGYVQLVAASRDDFERDLPRQSTENTKRMVEYPGRAHLKWIGKMRGVCYGAHPLHFFRVFWIFSVVKPYFVFVCIRIFSRVSRISRFSSPRICILSVVKPYFVFVRVLFLRIKRKRETTKRFQSLTTEKIQNTRKKCKIQPQRMNSGLGN